MPNTTTAAIMVSFPLAPRPHPKASDGWNKKTLGRTFQNSKITMTYCFCFPDRKNQGDVDETETQLTLTMIIVLCVASLVAVAMICVTIVVVVMYKRWSAKHEAWTSERIIPPATRAKKPKVLKI